MIEIASFVKNKNIILVGNSKKLLECKNGKTIDSYDVVVRFNHGGPKTENRIYTGSRCDIWIYAMVKDGACRARYKEFKNKPKYCMRYGDRVPDGIPSILFNPDRDLVKLELGFNKHISTGIMSLYHFLMFGCKSITLTGFDGFKTHNFYTTNEKIIANKYHEPNKEREYIEKLLEDKKICLL